MYSILKITKIIYAIMLCCTLYPSALYAAEDGEQASEAPGFSIDSLRLMAERAEGIGAAPPPPIMRPQFINVSDASLSMDDREPVFVVHYPNNLVRVYPQGILVWHEVVNDSLPPQLETGTNYSSAAPVQTSDNTYTISYSPFTGCVTAFKSVAGRFPTAFAASGSILNGNTVLIDRTTYTQWSQLLAVGIEGPLRGKRLQRYPIYWARWGGVKNRYPHAQVLARYTSYRRNYGRDPYGSYLSTGNYYDDVNVPFMLAYRSNRLPPKQRILGVEIGSLYGAIIVDAVKEVEALNQSLGIHKVVAFYDKELESIRVFNRRLKNGTVLNFEIFEQKFVDTASRGEWNSDGECTYGRMRGLKLEPILAIDSMWFSWFAFHPNTQVLGKEAEKPIKGPQIPY